MICSKSTPPRRASETPSRAADRQTAGGCPEFPLRPLSIDDHVLDVNVINPLGKGAQKLDRIDSLPNQMAGIEVEAELFTPIERLERSLGGIEVEGDLRGMNFQREPDAALAEDVQNRIEALGQQIEARVDLGRRQRRIGVEQMPNARTGKAVHDVDPQLSAPPERCSSVLRWPAAFTPAGSPSPQTWAGRIAWCRLIDRGRAPPGRPDGR